VLAAGGIVLTQFLTSSIDYYCNVDEVGVKDGCEAGRRLRVQGTVEEGSIVRDGGVTSFTIEFGGRRMPVRYEGDPGGLFQECIPVVVHGRLGAQVAAAGAAAGAAPVAGAQVFDGDRVEVKHSNEYTADNGGRLDDAEAAACSQQA